MSILNIRKAVRTGSKVVIGLSSLSGDGKTFTALKLARGMVDHAGEIGFLDTENRRGSLYSDILDGSFLIGDLYPPFSPQRYADAIKEFQNAGVKVLVIDSVTHEWEGEGGCEDIANAPLSQGKRMADWKKAKAEHKKFMNALLQSDMHVIVCIRAREKTDFSNPQQPVSLGIQPITEKNFMFEMTASLMLQNGGKNQYFLKMPQALLSSFGNGADYLSEDHGKLLSDWVESGEKIDDGLERVKSDMQMACSSGVDSLKTAWLAMPKQYQQTMKPMWSNYESAAKAYDEQKVEDQPERQKVTGFNPVQTENQIKQEQQSEPEQKPEQPGEFKGFD